MGNGLLGLYMNPNMPPEVVKAMAERGLNPDGSRMATQDRLTAINDRISADWQAMGFAPLAGIQPQQTALPPPPDLAEGANSFFADPEYMPASPPEFGAETRAKLAENERMIGAGIDRTQAQADAIFNQQPSMMQQAAPRNAISGMDYTPALPPPPVQPPIPKPTPRPRPTAYVVKKGDNPTKIARMFGMTLSELEARNPGILKRARKLRPGSSVAL